MDLFAFRLPRRAAAFFIFLCFYIYVFGLALLFSAPGVDSRAFPSHEAAHFEPEVQKNEGTVGNKSMTADLCIPSLEQSDLFVEIVIVDRYAERVKQNYATSVHDPADGCMTENEAQPDSNLQRTDLIVDDVCVGRGTYLPLKSCLASSKCTNHFSINKPSTYNILPVSLQSHPLISSPPMAFFSGAFFFLLRLLMTLSFFFLSSSPAVEPRVIPPPLPPDSNGTEYGYNSPYHD